jgi:DNA-binding response OmpR family regulator
VRILLLGHEVGASALTKVLEAANLQVTPASAPTDVLESAKGSFDAVLLGPDGSLDQRAGQCRALRDLGYLSAILALCENPTDGERLLEAGADDFVIAPYGPPELIARLRACARRTLDRWQLRWGAIHLDRMGRVVRIADARVSLSARECDLLACLMEEGGRIVTRAKLRERVWHRKEDRGTNLVEVHLSRLRDKLGEHAAVIETVRGEGYRLRR